MCEILRNNQRNFKEQTVSTCVEATRCKYAPNLEAIEVDVSPIASVADDEHMDLPKFKCLYLSKYRHKHGSQIHQFWQAFCVG